MTNNDLAKILILYLTSPASDFYLSKLLAGSTSPRLEPLTVAGLSLGSQTIFGENIALSLQQLTVQGLSNIQIAKNGTQPEITVTGNAVSFTAVLPNTEAPPPNVPSQLTLTAYLAVTPATTPAFGGNLTVTVGQGQLTGNFTATSADGTLPQASIDFTNLAVAAATGSGNIQVALSLDSPLSGFITSMLNQSAVQNMIISGLTSSLNQPNVLQALSQSATTAARQLLGTP